LAVVDAWTFIALLLILKIPMVAMFLLVRWAMREDPVPGTTTDEDGGISADTYGPQHPTHPRPRLPRNPRRGPHGGLPTPAPPTRVRAVVAHTRLTRRLHA
jgi:hypothetical protein